jgi:hypothetical protein
MISCRQLQHCPGLDLWTILSSTSQTFHLVTSNIYAKTRVGFQTFLCPLLFLCLFPNVTILNRYEHHLNTYSYKYVALATMTQICQSSLFDILTFFDRQSLAHFCGRGQDIRERAQARRRCEKKAG